jgi:hypothetical protein
MKSLIITRTYKLNSVDVKKNKKHQVSVQALNVQVRNNSSDMKLYKFIITINC